MNVIELLDLAKSEAGLATDSGLASRLGVTKQAVSNWRHGTKTPDPVTCEKLAEISGIPLHRVLGMVGEVRAISAAEKRVWRKLATAAVLSILLTPSAYASAILSAAPSSDDASNRCIMRKVRKILARLAQALQRPGHDQSPAVLA